MRSRESESERKRGTSREVLFRREFPSLQYLPQFLLSLTSSSSSLESIKVRKGRAGHGDHRRSDGGEHAGCDWQR